MSTEVEQRVVEMKFDNARFEQNASETISTLDKLRQSLKLPGATKGLQDVDVAAKNVDLSGLSNGVQMVETKFSSLRVMAVTALANITNSAVNYGKRIVSALTLDPITTGFQEYETQINAVQTILANTSSKGTTMDDVNSALDQLNAYADKTIYNFTEMTRNIGTFTAAGIDLDTSVNAIQGIANLAAVSGSTSQQASTAMYQLSQALSSGTVRLMDWNSVVNAGMGGEVFQNALKETARAHGIAIDDIIDKQGSFRESLSEGWLSAEILTDTLQKFTLTTEGLTEAEIEANREMLRSKGYTDDQIDEIFKLGETATDAATKVKTFSQLWDTLKEAAQSGWTQTWEIIVGDFEEAKELLTEVSNVIGNMLNDSAKARNDLLQGWKDAGGRADLVESIKNAFEGVMSIVKPIKEAFRDIFPPLTVQQLTNFTARLKDLTSKLTISDEVSDKLKRTFKGLFATVDIAKQILLGTFKIFTPLFSGATKFSGGILGLTASIGDALVKFNEFIKVGDVFGKIGTFIGTVIETIVLKLSKFFSAFKNNILLPLIERIRDRFYGIGEAVENASQKVSSSMKKMGQSAENSGFVQTLKTIWEILKKLTTGIMGAFGKFAKGVMDKIGNANFDNLLDFLNTISMGGISAMIMMFVKSLYGISDSCAGIGGTFKEMMEGVKGAIDDVRGCFQAYQEQLKAGTLLKIASAIAILAASIFVIALIDSDKLAASLGAITVLFADLMGSLAIFSKITKNTKGVVKAVGSMIGISVAVLIMASALKKIGDLEPGQLAAGVIGIIALTAVIIGAAKILGSGGKTVIKGAMQMILFSVAMKILASVCKDLSELSWEGLAKGLVGVGAFMGGIIFMLNTAKVGKKSISTALGMVLLASAIKILASACGVFAQLSWEGLAKGLVAVGGLLAVIAGFTRIAGNAKKMISAGVAMLAIGAALKIFASVIQLFAGMSIEGLAKGLISMGLALAAVVGTLKLLPKNTLSLSIGLIAVAYALSMITEAVMNMSSMSWEQIGKSMVVLAGALLMLTVALHAMKSTIGGAAAMAIAAVALAVLAPALILLGSMSWGGIVKGLVAMAGVFAVMGAAGYLLKPVVGVILALSVAFALFGVGMLAVGAGLSVLSVGLMAFLTTVVSVIPLIGAALVGLCNVIIETVPALGEAFKAVALTVIDVLVELIPVLADGILKLLVGLFEALVEYTPQLVDLIFYFVIGLLEGLARNLPDLIQATVDVVMAFFSGVIDALGTVDTKTLVQGIAGVGIITALMAAIAAVGALVPAAMLGVIGLGLFIGELMLVFAAIGAFAQLPGLEWLISEGGNILGLLGKAIGQFFGGILGGIAQGMTSSLPAIGTHLSQFMENAKPFIDGVKLMDPSVMEGVKSLAGAILALTAANVLDGLTAWFTGGASLADFGQELAAFGPYMAEYAAAVKGINPETVEASANAAKALSEMAANLPNSGGVVGWFTGENDMSTFGTQLVSFGKSIKDYSLAVVGLNVEAINASVTAGTALSEMAASIPNLGGVVSWFCGDNDLSTFGQNILSFGGSLKEYSSEVTGINITAITASVTAANKLSELQGSLDKTGGVVSWFVGTNSLSKFGKNLKKFGTAMKEYSVEISGISASSIGAATAEFKKLSDMARGIADVDFKGLTSFGKSLGTISKRGVENFISAFEDASDKVSEAGGKLIENVIKGMNEKTIDMKNTARDIATAAVDAIKDKLPSFSGAGSDVVSGFANGISVNTFKAEAAARAMANAAAAAAKKALDEHSPSKVFYGIGDFAGVAFVSALDDSVGSAYDSGYSVADHARKGLSAAISTVTDLLNSEMDTQPTITPVLDLSDIKSGAGVIGDLLGLGSTIGVSANIGAVNKTMSNRNQNGETAELISSMDKLRKGLNNIGNTTYSINGINYDGGSDVAEAIQVLVRAAMMGGRA